MYEWRMPIPSTGRARIAVGAVVSLVAPGATAGTTAPGGAHWSMNCSRASSAYSPPSASTCACLPC
ncbi:hypothetical protein EIJ50_09580, partial [Xanthomonas perforans]